MIYSHRSASLPAFSRRVIMLATLAAVIGAAPVTHLADTPYGSSPDSGEVTIQGTSTLHDWTIKGSIIGGQLRMDGEWKADAAAQIKIQSIDLTIPVNSLKSSEGGGMDNTTYDALKSKQNPTLTYHLTEASLKTPPSKTDPAYHFKATGQLTVAGTQRPSELDLDVLPEADGRMTITTQTKMKMSDFGVAPPTAMLGIIKSGDAITVKVIWRLTPPTAAAKATK